MSPTYKLTYFNGRALGEPSRLIFAYAKVPYEDIRIDYGVWPEQKKNYPWGTVPVLEVDGQILAQSQAILRYLGKTFNLAGENEFESAKCDEIIESMADLRAASMKHFLENNEEKKNEIGIELETKTFPKFLTKFNEILIKNNGFFVGKQFSYADFCIASYLQIFRETYLGQGDLLEKYSSLQSHQDAVFNAPGIKEWVAKRPKTKF